MSAVAFVHRKTDEALAHIRTTCRGAGCSHCCGCDVMAHPEEVRAIVPHVSPEAWERVRRVAALPLMGMLAESCPLLDPDTKTCTVYDHRPAICRAFHSLEDPRRCRNGAKPVRRDPEPGRAMKTAAENVWGGIDAFDLLALQLVRLAP